MEVVLLKDVRRLGEAGDIVNVANGYARNYLMPRGLAVVATDAARKQAAQQAAAEARRRAAEKAEAQKKAEELGNIELVFTARTGESDRLYGSITSGDIAERLSERIGDEVDKRKVMLDEPIKELGSRKVPVRLHSDVQFEITVTVQAEEEE